MRNAMKRSEMQRLGTPARRKKPMSLALLRLHNKLVDPRTERLVQKSVDGVLTTVLSPAVCNRSPLSGFRKNKSPAIVRLNSQRLRIKLIHAYKLIDEMTKSSNDRPAKTSGHSFPNM